MMKEKGLTLVETLLTVVLLSIIVIIIGGTTNLSKLMLQQSSTDSAVQGNLKRTMQILTREVSEGLKRNDSRCPNACSTVSCSEELGNPNDVCIVPAQAVAFHIPEPFVSGTNNFSYRTINYTFNSNSQIILRTEISSDLMTTTTQIVARNISAVDFQNISSDPYATVIQITLTSGTISHRSEVTLRSNRFEA